MKLETILRHSGLPVQEIEEANSGDPHLYFVDEHIPEFRRSFPEPRLPGSAKLL